MKGENEIEVFKQISGQDKLTVAQANLKLKYIKGKQEYKDKFNELKDYLDKKLKQDLTWTIERATESLLVIVEAAKTIIAEDLEIRFETETTTELDPKTKEKKQVLVWKKDPYNFGKIITEIIGVFIL